MESSLDSTQPPVAEPPVLQAPPVLPPSAPSIPPRESAPRAPPVWPSLLAPIVALVGAALASATVLLLIALLSDTQPNQETLVEDFEGWMEANAASFPIVFALLVPAQVVFFGTAAFFAFFDRERWGSRLGFVRPTVPFSTMVLAVVGTLGVQFAISVIAEGLIEEPSSALKALTKMFMAPQGIAAVGVGLLMSVLPGLCEESMFRGFTQRGLLRRWHPAVAIGVTSLLFALAHFDVQHSIAVIPLGVWIGFVAWKAGSVWPAVWGHFVNNGVAFVVLRLWGDPEEFVGPKTAVYYVVGAAFLVVTFIAGSRLTRARPA